jgi:uncharacterized membrane protein
MKRNSELKDQALAALEGKWVMGALATIIYGFLSGALSYIIPIFGSIISFFLLPLGWGFAIIFLKVKRGEDLSIGTLFDGFKEYARIFLTMLLRNVYIFLWTLLLVIPGIIKGYSYVITDYILKDRPDLSYDAAITESMRMMNGYKMKLFLLDLSFIGWGILCILTLGIGFLFLYPYMQTSHAAFYEDLKAELQGIGEETVIIEETVTITAE